MSVREIRRCSRCILPETTPNITFNKQGVCNYCRTHKKIKYKGEFELLRILKSYRRKDSKYDCIVTISGGRDSSYVLLKLVKDYQMRVLAVNYENPFTHPQAKINIENAIKILNVDIVRFGFKGNIHERTFKNNLLAWLHRPSTAMVNMMCIACRMVDWEVLKIARRYNIRCIVGGSNPFEDIIFKRELLHASKDDSYTTAIAKSLYGVLKETSKNPRYLNPQCIPIMVKGYIFALMNTLAPKLPGHHITNISLFRFIEWNEEEVLSRIRAELNWDSPHELDSTWRFDCLVGHLKDLMYMRTIGLTEREDFYAKMVREGLMTRERALTRLKKENKIHLNEIKSVLNRVGIKDIPLLNGLDSRNES